MDVVGRDFKAIHVAVEDHGFAGPRLQVVDIVPLNDQSRDGLGRGGSINGNAKCVSIDVGVVDMMDPVVAKSDVPAFSGDENACGHEVFIRCPVIPQFESFDDEVRLVLDEDLRGVSGRGNFAACAENRFFPGMIFEGDGIPIGSRDVDGHKLPVNSLTDENRIPGTDGVSCFLDCFPWLKQCSGVGVLSVWGNRVFRRVSGTKDSTSQQKNCHSWDKGAHQDDNDTVSRGMAKFKGQKKPPGISPRAVSFVGRETLFYFCSSSTACAAARRATGTRNGEQLT